MNRGRPKKPEGAKIVANFRLHPTTIEAMDRLITNPPAIAIDGLRGAARTRTELLEILVKKASEELADEGKTSKTSKTSKTR